MTLDAVLARIDDSLPEAPDRLLALLRIPQVSTDPAFAPACDAAADWLVAELTALGFAASKRPAPGHPMVLAHRKGTGRHLMFYGHYNVQAVDPLELWHRDPFDPAIEDTPRGRVIRGRGASDGNGQVMTFVKACRAWKSVHGTLPGPLTLLFEGEEDSGSPSLVPFMKENAAGLTADLALICDTGLFNDATPAIVTQLRGMAKADFTLRAADRDLHSGMYGGLAANPIHVLTRILAGLHDQGRVTLPGFYDGVHEVPDAMRAQWQGLAFDHAKFPGDVDLPVPAGAPDRTPLEMIWSRPTAEVNGIRGACTGDGFKTVLPSEAHAKVSFRLVGTQDPDAVLASFRSYIEAALPADCDVIFHGLNGSAAGHMSVDNPAFDQARAALTEEWGRPAAFVGCGGSIPIAGFFKTVLGMDAMLIGFAKDDDLIHSPNEKYDVESFRKGIRSWARILDRLGS